MATAPKAALARRGDGIAALPLPPAAAADAELMKLALLIAPAPVDDKKLALFNKGKLAAVAAEDDEAAAAPPPLPLLVLAV